jgi:hypothetical protein
MAVVLIKKKKREIHFVKKSEIHLQVNSTKKSPYPSSLLQFTSGPQDFAGVLLVVTLRMLHCNARQHRQDDSALTR